MVLLVGEAIKGLKGIYGMLLGGYLLFIFCLVAVMGAVGFAVGF